LRLPALRSPSAAQRAPSTRRRRRQRRTARARSADQGLSSQT
jgi:hypothetical protein